MSIGEVERCGRPGCAGARLQGGHCLQHLLAAEFDAAVQRLRSGEPLDARNTTISSECLQALLTAITSDADQAVLPAANFRWATFSGDVDFGGADFSGSASFFNSAFMGDARFEDATFSSDASFAGAAFNGAARFRGASFKGPAEYYRATFCDQAAFSGATFSDSADFNSVTLNDRADFSDVTFGDRAEFNSVTFNAHTDFGRATFKDGASFGVVSFNGVVRFTETTFRTTAFFRGATFGNHAFFRTTFGDAADFTGATFRDRADFNEATFCDRAGFGAATFDDRVDFSGTTFSGQVFLQRATFRGHAFFVGATFSDHARLDAATFGCVANFTRATFDRARKLGPLVVSQRLVLDDCVFVERVSIDVAAVVVSAQGTTFAAGVHLRVRWAEIALDDADFARASTLSGATGWPPELDLPALCMADDRHIELEPRPRLIALRGAHVAALSLADIDLRACRFFGAHGLESLSIEASCTRPRTPPARRYVGRETIAEEHQWRGSVWDEPSVRAPDWLDGSYGTEWLLPAQRAALYRALREAREDDKAKAGATHERLQPAQIASLYRALRKAREDDKDEPGANDMYYGEMEMRRHGPTAASQARRARLPVDRVILQAYWLLSGYGLRPIRALASLALALLTSAALLWWFGFHEARSYGRSLLFAIESSLSLLRPRSTRLTAGGEVIQITLRLLGPLLVGLALLAVRARVKR